MRLRSRSGSLIWRNFGVTLDQLYAIQRNRKFFRHELGLRGVEPMPQLALAGESGNVAIGGYGQPTIDLIAAGSIEFFFTSRRRHTSSYGDWSSRRVLFRSVLQTNLVSDLAGVPSSRTPTWSTPGASPKP